MRLFLATRIKPEIIYSNDGLNSLEDHLNCSIKFVESENIHLTWKFMGEVPENRLEETLNMIQKSLTEPFKIVVRFHKFEMWPDGRFPRQLVATGEELTGDGARLYKYLNNNLASICAKKEKRPFKPHITVGRFRLKKKPDKPLILPEILSFKESIIDFSQICLIESKLSPKGSTYNIIRTFDIG
jgi:RNA 2',3'-cyclic 3'-phosphodiesterase